MQVVYAEIAILSQYLVSLLLTLPPAGVVNTTPSDHRHRAASCDTSLAVSGGVC